jgi:plastocyanin
MKRLTLTLGMVALAAVLAACSGASAAPGSQAPVPAGSPSGDSVAITAKDITFVETAVTVKAGSPFSIAFDNQDGAPHNIKISDASGAKVFAGDIVSSQKVTYSVQALAAGTYTFICEVHPNMTGTITAQ